MRSINKEIIALAVPAIVTNITTPLLGLIDTAITGHLGSPAYIAAIAVGAGMFSLAYWPLNFLCMGTSGLASQAYGASISASPREGASRASGECDVVLARALLLAGALAVLLLAFSPLICRGLLWFLDADASTSSLAYAYFMIVIFGCPAVLGTYAFTGWFLGMQDAKAPMWMALFTNVSNILISLWLVFGLHMKIEGVAIGTLSAQWIGLLAGIALWRKKYGAKGLKGLNLAALLQGAALKRFFKVNADIFFRTLCLAAVTIWFTRAGAVQGANVLAANALLMQLFILFSYFMDGFAFAGEAMAGKYFGMGEGGMLKRTIRGVFYWGFAMVALFTAAYAFGGRLVLEALTDDRAIVALAMIYLPWAAAIPIAGIAAFVWDGIFIGLTLTRSMLISMAIAMSVYFACYWLMEPTLGNHGLWLAFIAYLASRGLVQSVQYHFKRKRLYSLMPLR